jgi:hypothetical protein
MPSTVWPAVRCLLTGLLCYIGMHYNSQFPIQKLADPVFLATSSFWCVRMHRRRHHHSDKTYIDAHRPRPKQ